MRISNIRFTLVPKKKTVQQCFITEYYEKLPYARGTSKPFLGAIFTKIPHFYKDGDRRFSPLGLKIDP